MYKKEAQQLLDDFAAVLSSRFTYLEWQKLSGEGDVAEKQGASGVT